MKYIAPIYDKEIIEATDVILTSIDLGNGVTFTHINESAAQVGASVLDVLGLR